jgi:hypothetical protein
MAKIRDAFFFNFRYEFAEEDERNTRKICKEFCE